ncbi:FG-GAP-like repeat-containing protein [Novosphingobium bradum]|uniref:FG-GAP-like repeat-containing protein n=1 Tax=Novosphingobium bradum TaxID=1737444 RepID=A0ABV7ITA7_9SPHN
MTVVTDYTALLSDSISSSPGKAAFYTYSFAATPPAYLADTYSAAQLASFRPLTSAEQGVARTALNMWASASGVTLFEVTQGVGDINFGVYDMALLGQAGFAGFAYYGTDSRYGVDSDVFLSSADASNLHVVLHEVGHAFGLKHPFDGTITLDPSLNDFAHTVMSYTPGSSTGSTLGTFDLQAIQYLYGSASNDGTQVASWSWNATTETLTQTGSAAADIIAGVAARDIISGGLGADSITGGSGGDSLDGGDGNDTISAVVAPGYGAVTMLGGTGDDSLSLQIATSAPAFSIDGGTGNDTLTITSAAYYSPFIVSLASSAVQIANVERVYVLGGPAADQITGTAAGEQIQGFAGADYLAGLGGNDTFFGGDGADTLVGGAGVDYLSGDGGADRFVFLDATDSTPVATDTIADFATGTDLFDTSAMPLWDVQVTGAGGSWAVSGAGLSGAFRVTVNGTFALSDVVRQTVGVHLVGTASAESLTGLAGRDFLEGSAGNDTLSGAGGGDYLSGGTGNDVLDGGAGNDVALVADARGAVTVSHDQTAHTLVLATTTEGTDRLVRVEQVRFSDGLYSFAFTNPGAAVVANFNPANGWASQDQYPRHVADINGDGYADIVGFGYAGVLVSFGSAAGTFSTAAVVVSNFGQTAGWANDNGFHRELADINGDGRADILGFGYAGTLVSLAKANGTFDNPFTGVADFGVNQGWANQNGFARTVGDVNGDGKADLVGFGYAGTLVSLGNGDGTFKPVITGLANFGVNQGWTSDNAFHRALADVNGDGKADLIGFGQGGTLVALSNGDGTFANANLVLANFGAGQGWTSNDASNRLVVDVNGDHIADIVGFGPTGTLVAFGNGDGTFTDAGQDLANFGSGQGWTSDNTFHREVADMNHDGLADVVGFGIAGVLVGLNQGDFLL